MFAKRTKPPKPPQRPAEDVSRTTESGPDPRDAKIARLERELADERRSVLATRQALDAATFKIEVLEKSYAKQLVDVRERLAATERDLADKSGVLGALDGGHEDALRTLNAARAELKLVSAERDRLREQLARDGFRASAAAETRAPLASMTETSGGGTINELIASSGWAEPKPASSGSGHAGARAAEHEPAHEEMLAPELVFTHDADDETER